MANWEQLGGSRGNVVDRRGQAVAGIGGLGLIGTIIALALSYFTGGSTDVGSILEQLQNVPVQTQQFGESDMQFSNDYPVFASTVLGSNNDMWRAFFTDAGRTYTEPRLVLFRTATDTGCGGTSSQVGPHYCSLDSTIYLDETFFDELQARFKAQGGDVAEAYVISHEVAHHVQYLLGTIGELEQQSDEAMREKSIEIELQADCFAGVWAYSIRDKGVFEEGEINEALDAAAAVGDDRIQQTVAGRVSPESWTHGSSEQRQEWFRRGFTTGDPSNCDTSNVI